MYAGGSDFPVDVIFSFFCFNAGGSDFPVDVIFSYFLKLFWADFNSIKLVNIPSCDFVAFWLLRCCTLLFILSVPLSPVTV